MARSTVMDLTTLVSGHLRYFSLGSPLLGILTSSSIRTTGAGQAPASGQGTAASPAPSSIRRHRPRREGPNLKKTQRQHSVSGAERRGYCQCLDAVVPTHLTLNFKVSRDLQLSVLRLVRVDRLQLLNSLPRQLLIWEKS